MSSGSKHENDSFPEENELDDKSKLESLESSEHEEDSDIEEETLHDLMADFFLNENGDNIATVLTNIQTSIDQNSKCLLKLTKVLQEYFASVSSKK
jgi:hypothetical protein